MTNINGSEEVYNYENTENKISRVNKRQPRNGPSYFVQFATTVPKKNIIELLKRVIVHNYTQKLGACDT